MRISVYLANLLTRRKEEKGKGGRKVEESSFIYFHHYCNKSKLSVSRSTFPVFTYACVARKRSSRGCVSSFAQREIM